MKEDDEPKETVVRREGPNLFIYEEGEFCCVCKTVKDLISFQLGAVPGHENEEPLKYTVCNPCFDKSSGDSRFIQWLAGEFERALASRPDKWRKNPDGTWTEVDAGHD